MPFVQDERRHRAPKWQFLAEDEVRRKMAVFGLYIFFPEPAIICTSLPTKGTMMRALSSRLREHDMESNEKVCDSS